MPFGPCLSENEITLWDVGSQLGLHEPPHCCQGVLVVANSGLYFLNSTQREKAQEEEKAVVQRNTGKNENSDGRVMITPALREALTKQGDGLPGLGHSCSARPRAQMGSIGQGCHRRRSLLLPSVE